MFWKYAGNLQDRTLMPKCDFNKVALQKTDIYEIKKTMHFLLVTTKRFVVSNALGHIMTVTQRDVSLKTVIFQTNESSTNYVKWEYEIYLQLVYMCSCYKFVCSLFTQEFWVLVRSDSAFAPYKSSNISASHNICSPQPPTT